MNGRAVICNTDQIYKGLTVETIHMSTSAQPPQFRPCPSPISQTHQAPWTLARIPLGWRPAKAFIE